MARYSRIYRLIDLEGAPSRWRSIALILSVDRFMSEARALTNLIGNGVATVVVSKALRGEAPMATMWPTSMPRWSPLKLLVPQQKQHYLQVTSLAVN